MPGFCMTCIKVAFNECCDMLTLIFWLLADSNPLVLGACRTPLYSAILANIANFMMDIVLIFGLGWGVAGAALATSFSQYVGVAAMLALLHRRRILDFADLRIVPSLADIAPLLWVGHTARGSLLLSCAHGSGSAC
jgi:Na+-driven multidrug efflux pump